eukprot:6200590-Pleurochrysis_carterae.AAC.1
MTVIEGVSPARVWALGGASALLFATVSLLMRRSAHPSLALESGLTPSGYTCFVYGTSSAGVSFCRATPP